MINDLRIERRMKGRGSRPDRLPVKQEIISRVPGTCEICAREISLAQIQKCINARASELCPACFEGLKESFEAEAYREECHEKAREERYEKAREEREAWREERREERVQQWVEERDGRCAADYPWGGIVRR